MPFLRLTTKLLAEINDEPSPESAAAPSPLGDWYGHIFTVERRKCLMFVNERTLFVCPALGVLKSDYRRIVPFFTNVLAATLRIMRFSNQELEWILAQHQKLQIGRTISRSPMGSLNNRIGDTKWILASRGSIDVCDIGPIAKLLNDTPMKPIGYTNGLEQMREVVSNRMH